MREMRRVRRAAAGSGTRCAARCCSSRRMKYNLDSHLLDQDAQSGRFARNRTLACILRHGRSCPHVADAALLIDRRDLPVGATHR